MFPAFVYYCEVVDIGEILRSSNPILIWTV